MTAAVDQARLDAVRREWLAITRKPPVDADRFAQVKQEADALVAAGHWVSGPSDLLTVVGRHRDELLHSRLIGWLLVPTNRHGLGRAVLTGFADALWPGEGLLRSGPVTVDLEVVASGEDDTGGVHEARADLVLRGDGVTVVIENKVDAGEQPAQCERLYWAWAGEPGDTRWVYLTPTGRAPVTASSPAAVAAWRSMSYGELRAVVEAASAGASGGTSLGRATAAQYLETLTRSVVPKHG